MTHTPLVKKVLRRALSSKAYQNVLRHHKIRPTEHSELDAFPITTKKNYVKKYALKDHFHSGPLPEFVYASSGSSGIPTYWTRHRAQEYAGGLEQERLLAEVYNIPRQESTLAIVGFYMGMWVAGNFTSDAFRVQSDMGRRVSVATPGFEKEKIIDCVQSLSPQYKHTILAGYPPLIMDVVKTLRAQKLLPKRLYILTAGVGYTEAWRNELLRTMRATKHPERVISVYGSADLGFIGFETPSTIALRKTLEQHPELIPLIAKDAVSTPCIFEYNPKHVHAETVEDQLLYTADTAIPLVRYQLGDRGSATSYKEILSRLTASGRKVSLPIPKNPKPLLVLAGRSDVSISYYAMYVYPEHLQDALADAHTNAFVEKSFLTYKRHIDGGAREEWHIELVLAPGITTSSSLSQKILAILTTHFLAKSYEFSKLKSELGSAADPIITLHKAGTKLSHSSQEPAILYEFGKKPRMVINRM